MSRRFTLAEAEKLLPLVERLLREAVASKAEYQEAERQIQAFTGQITLMGGMAVDRHRVLASRARRDESATHLKQAIEKVQETGCEVKDLDIGLIDFLSRFRGRDVCLCWKLGEQGIAFWHGVEEGFAGRKPIDREFLDHHEGDRAQ